jgi:hypothetical protein
MTANLLLSYFSAGCVSWEAFPGLGLTRIMVSFFFMSNNIRMCAFIKFHIKWISFTGTSKRLVPTKVEKNYLEDKTISI